MAEGLNRVMLLGNLGQDPELKVTQGGQAVLKLRLATTETYLDRNNTRQERTEWHRVALFGRLGEIAAEYLKKGSQVYIEGSLRTRKWQDKQGNERFSTEIVATRRIAHSAAAPTGPARLARGAAKPIAGTAASGTHTSIMLRVLR